jgi:class 3 adenylate cyclase/CheY-like chemotaxis protein
MSKNSGAPVRVLVVDDKESNIAMFGLILRSQGYTVLAAKSGEEALATAASGRPDIILLDVQMPGMDGCETARSLSTNEQTSSIPIVMVTGLAGLEDRVRALRAGAVDFLTKPVDPGELRAKVASLARLKGYNDEMRRRQVVLSEELVGKGGQLQAAMVSFARFVPQEFLQALNKPDIADVKLGDHVKLVLAILFSDIRSFTALSEKMTPEQNFGFLNSYLRRMDPFIWENNGFIDKYIGDAIMALFPKGSGSALSAAVAMLSYIPLYNSHRASFGYPPIGIGIGIHSGPVMLGVIGDERFMQGTAISDAVNLASRLQDLTREYGVSLIVSRHALFDLEDPNRFDYRLLDTLRLRGKEEAVSVYEVFDGDEARISEAKKKTREEFEKGVHDFHAGRFQEALARFNEMRGEENLDPPVEIYRRRCARAIGLGVTDEIDDRNPSL